MDEFRNFYPITHVTKLLGHNGKKKSTFLVVLVLVDVHKSGKIGKKNTKTCFVLCGLKSAHWCMSCFPSSPIINLMNLNLKIFKMKNEKI